MTIRITENELHVQYENDAIIKIVRHTIFDPIYIEEDHFPTRVIIIYSWDKQSQYVGGEYDSIDVANNDKSGIL